jgi:hypothetical protein
MNITEATAGPEVSTKYTALHNSTPEEDGYQTDTVVSVDLQNLRPLPLRI